MGLRMVNFITIPAVCGLIVLATPIVQVLFQRGVFRASATQLCAGLLPYAAVGLVALAANVVLTRCCFACHETRWTVAISVFTVAVNIALSILWLPSLGARGLLLANSVSQSVQALCLFALVWRLVHGLDWTVLVRSAARVALASLVMVSTLHWVASLGAVPADTFASRAWYLFGQLAIGSLVFVAVAQFIGVEELVIAVQLIVQKFERRLMSPPENREVPIA
jgi:putative peptidoglycan lipid II flippase